MLIRQTIDSLKSLRLHGMAQACEDHRNNSITQGLGCDERLGLMVDAEIHDRENRRLQRLLKAAKLKVSACVEDIDYTARRGLDRQVVANLTTCD